MSISDYKRDALVAQEKLEEVSPTFCLAKWNQVSLHLPTGLTNSCYHPPLHKIDATKLDNNPAALHNTAEKLQQRELMLKGERPDGCSYCWKMEDTGEMSDRHYRSGEPWAIQDFDAIKQNPMSTSWTPRYVEVNFNHACNFKCSYCSPQFSTTWGKEIERYGEFPTTPPHNAPEHFQGRNRPIPNREHNPYVDAFWKWWPELYKNLKHFRMTGGEPMMDHNTYKVFQYVIDHPKDDLHLNITSNMCPPDPKLKQKYFNMLQTICLQEKVEHVMQFVSVDTWGKQAEYQRHGLEFNRFWDNLNKILEKCPRVNTTIMSTYNALSVPSYKKLLDGVYGLKKTYGSDDRYWNSAVFLDASYLRYPTHQTVQVLPQKWSMEILQQAQYADYLGVPLFDTKHIGYSDIEIQKLKRLYDWMISANDKDSINRQRYNFGKFFKEHDIRRGTNFKETFPEFAEFYDDCQRIKL